MLKLHDVSRADDHSASSLGRGENPRMKKTDSLKENDETMKRSRPLVSRATKISSTLASRSASTNFPSSGKVDKRLTKRPEPAYPPYNYADNIPIPKVIYIRNEEQANEMVASLNG